LHLRRSNKAIQQGTIQLLDGPEINKNLVAYRRQHGDELALVLINLGKTPCTFQNDTACKRVLFEIGLNKVANLGRISLPPYSGVILGN
jgi:hypothetical protein